MELLKRMAWSFIALNAVVLLLQFFVVAQITVHEGQQGWAMLFAILTTMIAVLGCVVFALGIRRKSSNAVAFSMMILIFPLIISLLIVFDELM